MLQSAGRPLGGRHQHGVPLHSLRFQHIMLRPPAWRPSRKSRFAIAAAEPKDEDTSNGGDLTESQLARLEKAEREAAMLREQLKIAQQIQAERGDQPASAATKRRGPRIDAGEVLKRENLLTGGGLRSYMKERGSWVAEKDLEELFWRSTDGPSEGGRAATLAEEATVQRRLLLGLGAAALLGTLALVPLDVLTPAPSKPLFLYLTPLVRVQALLREAGAIVQDAQWDEMRFILERIQGPPNYVRDNLVSAAAALQDDGKRDRAKALAADILYYVAQIDFDKYFDTQSSRSGLGGRRNQEFVDFSASSVKATQTKLVEFLRLFPAEDVEAARELAAQLAAPPPAEFFAGVDIEGRAKPAIT